MSTPTSRTTSLPCRWTIAPATAWGWWRAPTVAASSWGYFFGPARAEVPALSELGELAADAAVAVHWFGDLSLVRGEWPLIGRLPHWRRAAWPVPALGTYNVLLEQAFRLEYPHETFGVPVTRAEADALPWGALFGAGLVEGTLTDLLRTEGA